MRTASLMRPAVSLSAAADVVAGYVIASPATPRPEEALLVVPLLSASAALLHAAGEVFSACFGVESELTPFSQGRGRPGGPAVVLARAIDRNRMTLKGAFVTGAACALAGLFAAMAAAVTSGRLPVYAAGFVFLVGWARAGRTASLPVVGPVTAGLQRSMTLAVGMAAHGEVVYGQSLSPFLAAGLYLAYGALAETLEESLGEGGRRYTILAAFGGTLAVFAGAAALFVRTSPALGVALAGGVFLVARALPALRTLVPGAVRRLAEAAWLSGLFLAAALAWGRWPTQGTVLVLGAAPLVLLIPCAVLFAREETVPVPASVEQEEII